MAALLDISDLTISFPAFDGRTRLPVVDGVSLSLEPGERLGIVGESGSGKTMIGRAILGLLPPGGRIDRGVIRFDGADLNTLPPRQMRQIRGRRIGMIFQEPMVSLNPALTIGRQMTEGPMLHDGLSRKQAEAKAAAMLERVRLPEPGAALARYPHSFSGGMRQRIMLASVLLLRPDLLIADEPTTALDAIIQKEVLDLMMDLVRDLETALILVSHDLPLVAKYAARVVVMRRGVVMETGAVDRIMAAPTNDYTRALLDALPGKGGQTNGAATAATIVEARDVSVTFAGARTWPWSRPAVTRAVDDVSLAVHAGEIVGLVGESGSGKTTLGRAILDLVPVSAGTVLLNGAPRAKAGRAAYRDMGIVFQDPYSSLDPRMRVRDIVAEGLRHQQALARADKTARVAEILTAVQMPDAQFGDRYPHELSGGQRQRVCIARALVTHPRFVVADEPVSALDLTVQKEILGLLKTLQARLGFAALFISHDIGVVEEIADRVAVMFHGRLVEAAGKASFFDMPCHPYSRRLLGAVPELAAASDGTRRVRDRATAAQPPPPGYVFAEPRHDRARYAYVEVRPGHLVACVPTAGLGQG